MVGGFQVFQFLGHRHQRLVGYGLRHHYVYGGVDGRQPFFGGGGENRRGESLPRILERRHSHDLTHELFPVGYGRDRRVAIVCNDEYAFGHGWPERRRRDYRILFVPPRIRVCGDDGFGKRKCVDFGGYGLDRDGHSVCWIEEVGAL